MEHIESISGYLVENGVVSARWLSNVLRLNYDASVAALSLYKQQHQAVAADYLVTGLNSAGIYSFQIVSEEELNSKKELLKHSSAPQIYSIQQSRTDGAFLLMADLDYHQAHELLQMRLPNSSDFCKNAYGRISGNNIVIKPVGERIVNDIVPAATAGVMKAKETAEEHMSRLFANSTSTTKVSKASTTQPTAFFAKTTTTTKVTSSSADTVSIPKTGKKSDPKKEESTNKKFEKTVEPVEETKASTTSSRLVKNNSAADNDDDEAEFDAEYQVDTNKRKPTARIVIESDEDNDDLLESSASTDNKGKKRERSSAKTTKKEPVVVHGAMDDFFEDQAIAAHAKGVDTTAPKKKKQKLVEKVINCCVLHLSI